MPQRKITKTDAEWRAQLTPEQYRIARQAGTERPFTGEHTDRDDAGTYHCVGCGAKLFDADTKYHSGCGWPSFYAPADPDQIEERRDTSHGMIRTEVLCHDCGAHLGHVFPDGPRPTGIRYCINSAILDFKPADD